ncbi:LAME_0B01816g1_1 [Lachancea meyersii CBS 8951]|uniref:LAME_0B01816g1_1 n=1 Tax=Lachancea meyersii CBS 8951 TaxID=1266667 RepID=A0A1G4ITD1_9SACH|nr:LAME_0B01816g1_1 [Lachancea meyersii CBS 8951]
MSFDWLNVPGLSPVDSDHISGAASPPPPVSFDFGSRVSEKKADISVSNGGTEYTETNEDSKVPLSLSKSQLSKEEVRTYLRWYGYITSRKNAKLVKLDDVFCFMTNFLISQVVKERVAHIFKTCKNSLNIGQFFAVLRLLSRAMHDGVLPTRRMILESTPVPKPKSILAAGNEEVYEEIDDSQAGGPELKVDFDSFASLLLTGQKKKRMRRKITNYIKKLKKVRFSDNLVTFQDQTWHNPSDSQTDNDETIDSNEPLDLSLPMDQLLKNLAARKKNSALVSRPPSEQVPDTQEEKEALEDMKESLSHFQHLQKADNVARGGLPAEALQSKGGHEIPLEPLKPTATGSANYLFRSSQAPIQHMQQEPLKPTSTGSANHLFQSNVARNQKQSPQEPMFPLKPTATGSANNLFRSRQENGGIAPHKPGNSTFLSPNLLISNPRFGSSLTSTPDLGPASSTDAFTQPHSQFQQRPSTQNRQLQPSNHFSPAPNHYSPLPYQPSQFSNGYRGETTNQSQSHGLSSYGMSPQPTDQGHLNSRLGMNNQLFMSASPSPNGSTLQINQPPNSSHLQPHQTHMPPLAGHSSGGTFPIINSQGPIQTQHDRTYLHPSYTGPSHSGLSNTGYSLPPREAQSFSPSPAPRPDFYSRSPQNSFQSKDILGDLKALQEHVNQLQNTYNC